MLQQLHCHVHCVLGAEAASEKSPVNPFSIPLSSPSPALPCAAEDAGGTNEEDAEAARLAAAEAEALLDEEQKEVKRQRQAALEEAKRQAEAEAAATGGLKTKLERLIHQVAKYAQSSFKETKKEKGKAGGAAGGAAAGGAGDAGGKRGHHTLTEKEEDDELVAEADHGTGLVRLTTQPSILTGGQMREYQLEGLNWMIDLHHKDRKSVV